MLQSQGKVQLAGGQGHGNTGSWGWGCGGNPLLVQLGAGKRSLACQAEGEDQVGTIRAQEPERRTAAAPSRADGTQNNTDMAATAGLRPTVPAEACAPYVLTYSIPQWRQVQSEGGRKKNSLTQQI